MAAVSTTPRYSAGGILSRIVGLGTLTLLIMGAGEPPALRLPPPPDGAAFAIITRTPYLELKFHDVYIESARQNPGLNEIALDFTRPIEEGLIDRLPAVLPEWIEYAYAGYDSAVIKTRVPAEFSAVPVPDGFLLRIEPQRAPNDNLPIEAESARLAAAEGNTAQARQELTDLEARYPNDPYVYRTRAGIEASVGDWRAAERYYALARAGQPDDLSLRGSLAEVQRELGPTIATAITYTHYSGEDVISAAGRVDYPLYGRAGLVGEIGVTYGSGDSVTLSDGTVASLNKTVFSGALGANYTFSGGITAEGAALYSEAGLGARASLLSRSAISETELVGTYHAGYGETAGAVGSAASQDSIVFRHARRVAQGLWGEAALRLNRYSDDIGEIATSAGFSASLRYLREFYGWTGGLSYEVEGEYLLDQTLRPDGLGGTFVPLGIRDQEVHALSASASAPLGRNLWIDVYGGWAVDRYAGNGPYGGAALRYTPVAGLDLSAGASHSSVTASQGATGGVTTAGVSLTYKPGNGAAND